MDETPHPAATVAGIFAQAGLEYALIGGLAVNTWVTPRFTQDLDFVVVAKRAAIASAESALLESGFRYERRQDAGEPSGPDFVRMTNPATNTIIDLQVAKTDYQARVIDRAALSHGGVRVALVEDLIVLKLIAGRSKDQRDLSELAALPGVDWDLVRQEAAPWGVDQRLVALVASMQPRA